MDRLLISFPCEFLRFDSVKWAAHGWTAATEPKPWTRLNR